MAKETSILKLYQATHPEDNDKKFNVQTMLNDNWEKIDKAFLGTAANDIQVRKELTELKSEIAARQSSKKTGIGYYDLFNDTSGVTNLSNSTLNTSSNTIDIGSQGKVTMCSQDFTPELAQWGQQYFTKLSAQLYPEEMHWGQVQEDAIASTQIKLNTANKILDVNDKFYIDRKLIAPTTIKGKAVTQDLTMPNALSIGSPAWLNRNKPFYSMAQMGWELFWTKDGTQIQIYLDKHDGLGFQNFWKINISSGLILSYGGAIFENLLAIFTFESSGVRYYEIDLTNPPPMGQVISVAGELDIFGTQVTGLLSVEGMHVARYEEKIALAYYKKGEGYWVIQCAYDRTTRRMKFLGKVQVVRDSETFSPGGVNACPAIAFTSIGQLLIVVFGSQGVHLARVFYSNGAPTANYTHVHSSSNITMTNITLKQVELYCIINPYDNLPHIAVVISGDSQYEWQRRLALVGRSTKAYGNENWSSFDVLGSRQYNILDIFNNEGSVQLWFTNIDYNHVRLELATCNLSNGKIATYRYLNLPGINPAFNSTNIARQSIMPIPGRQDFLTTLATAPDGLKYQLYHIDSLYSNTYTLLSSELVDPPQWSYLLDNKVYIALQSGDIKIYDIISGTWITRATKFGTLNPVTFDGTKVWTANGTQLNAYDLATGKMETLKAYTASGVKVAAYWPSKNYIICTVEGYHVFYDIINNDWIQPNGDIQQNSDYDCGIFCNNILYVSRGGRYIDAIHISEDLQFNLRQTWSDDTISPSGSMAVLDKKPVVSVKINPSTVTKNVFSIAPIGNSPLQIPFLIPSGMVFNDTQINIATNSTLFDRPSIIMGHRTSLFAGKWQAGDGYEITLPEPVTVAMGDKIPVIDMKIKQKGTDLSLTGIDNQKFEYALSGLKDTETQIEIEGNKTAITKLVYSIG